MASFDSEEGFVDISGDGGLLKKVLQEGYGDVSPPSGDMVIAHYTGTLTNGEKFDSSRDRNKPFEFTIGQGQVIKGWDQGFATMKKGEKAILRCRSDYAYGKGGSGKIPPDATLNFDVELLDFHPKKKEKWELDDSEKEAEAVRLKDEGTMLFKEKRFHEAVDLYEEAASYIDESSALEALYVTCKLNASQACISCQRYPNAVEYATQALSKDSVNVKALYRRGLARNGLGMNDEALVDLHKALELDPENGAVKVEISKAKKSIADANKKAKATYGNMFSKISVYDDKVAPVMAGSDPNNPKVSSRIISLSPDYLIT